MQRSQVELTIVSYQSTCMIQRVPRFYCLTPCTQLFGDAGFEGRALWFSPALILYVRYYFGIVFECNGSKENFWHLTMYTVVGNIKRYSDKYFASYNLVLAIIHYTSSSPCLVAYHNHQVLVTPTATHCSRAHPASPKTLPHFRMNSPLGPCARSPSPFPV